MQKFIISVKDKTVGRDVIPPYIINSLDGLGDYSERVSPLVYSSSQIVNALPFLAYQKIYYDFYSNSQWEKHLAYSYNVDYWSGTGQLSLVTEMVKLRYANYPKDYFMGMLPSSQYGSVAVLPSINSSYSSANIIAANYGRIYRHIGTTYITY
jgi:hypothetical protein